MLLRIALLCLYITCAATNLVAQQISLKIKLDETISEAEADSTLIQFFPPIGGKYFNHYVPSNGIYDKKTRSVNFSFRMGQPIFMQLRFKRTSPYLLYAEGGDQVFAVAKKVNGRFTLEFTGKNNKANNLYNNILPSAYRQKLTDEIERNLNNDSLLFSYIEDEWTKTIAPFNKLHQEGELSKTGLAYFTTAIYADFFNRPLLNITVNQLRDNDTLTVHYFDKILGYIFKEKITHNNIIVCCRNGDAFISAYAKYMQLTGNANAKLPDFKVFNVYQRYGALTKTGQEYAFGEAFLIQRQLASNTFDLKKAAEVYKKIFPASPYINIIESEKQELYSSITFTNMPVKEKNSSNISKDDMATVVTFDGQKITIDSLVSLPSLTQIIQNYSSSSPAFIDFWASWCVPCIMEFDYVPQLRKKLLERNIKEIYISIDQRGQTDRWLEIIKRKKLYGMHILASNKLNKELKDAYLLNSIPRYMLVGKDGKIISGDTPRPGDPKLKELIDKSL